MQDESELHTHIHTHTPKALCTQNGIKRTHAQGHTHGIKHEWSVTVVSEVLAGGFPLWSWKGTSLGLLTYAHAHRVLDTHRQQSAQASIKAELSDLPLAVYLLILSLRSITGFLLFLASTYSRKQTNMKASITWKHMAVHYTLHLWKPHSLKG